MKYRLYIDIEVDRDAPFIESDPSTTREVIEEMFGDLLYDLDDIEVKTLEVEEK